MSYLPSYILEYHETDDGFRYKTMNLHVTRDSRIDNVGGRCVHAFGSDGDFSTSMVSNGETTRLDVAYHKKAITYIFFGRRNGPGWVCVNLDGGTYTGNWHIYNYPATRHQWEKWRDAHQKIPLTKNAAKLQ